MWYLVFVLFFSFKYRLQLNFFISTLLRYLLLQSALSEIQKPAPRLGFGAPPDQHIPTFAPTSPLPPQCLTREQLEGVLEDIERADEEVEEAEDEAKANEDPEHAPDFLPPRQLCNGMDL